MEQPAISILIPVLNEAAIIVARLEALQVLRNQGVELILVDGGSEDGCAQLAEKLVDKLLITEKGRARQMNLGAATAQGQYLVFLHADTRLPDDFIDCVQCWHQQPLWGFFALKLSGKNWPFRIIEKAISCRSKLTGIGTGDQVIFCHRELFQQTGGYMEIPLMEDIALCKGLKHIMPPKVMVKTAVTTSSRRWEENGIWRTVFFMWTLRLAYFLGVKPETLAARY